MDPTEPKTPFEFPSLEEAITTWGLDPNKVLGAPPEETTDAVRNSDTATPSRPPSVPPGPIDEWGPRRCPKCGAEPYVYCVSASGRKANLPHRERWPEGPPRVYGAKKRRSLELRDRETIKGVRQLPISDALKAIESTRMEAFRRQRDYA